jgi:hypothetical protein
MLGAFRDRFERFLSGRAPSDPLYLSNRTWKQKLVLASLIGVPLLILAALVAIGSTDVFRLNKADPYYHPIAEAPPNAAAPQPAPDPKLLAGDLEVVNIRILKDVVPPVVTGIVRNNTSRDVGSAEITYYLADEQGSLMGSESTSVQKIGPHASVAFRAPLKMEKAEYVLVRDVHPN